MSDDLAKLLQAQASVLQGVRLTPERAHELAQVVRPLNAAVAAAIEGHPYDVDATSYYAALERYRDRDDAP